MKRTDSKRRIGFMKPVLTAMAACALVFSAGTFTSCTEIFQEKVPEAPVFPEIGDLTFADMNTCQELTFEANMPWTLVSNEIWCKFISPEGEESNLVSGEAGIAKVKVMVTDEGQTTESKDDKVVLQLRMGNETQELSTVYRLAQGYLFQLLDKDGNVIPEKDWVVEAGIDPVPFTVRSNFPFVFKSCPDFVDRYSLKITGVVGETSTGYLKASWKQDKRYPVAASDENVLVFSNGQKDEAEKLFKIKVIFKGMPADQIEIESPANRKDWKVSMNGNGFEQLNTTIGKNPANVQKFTSLEFKVMALNDKTRIVYMEKSAGKYQIVDKSWFTVTSSKENYELKVTAADKPREAAVAVLPEAVYEKNKADLAAFFITKDGQLDYNHFREFGLAELIQGDFKIEEPVIFEITDELGKVIKIDRLTDPELLKTITGLGYSKNNLYVTHQNLKKYKLNHPVAKGRAQCKNLENRNYDYKSFKLQADYRNPQHADLEFVNDVEPGKPLLYVISNTQGEKYVLVFLSHEA